MAHKMEAQKKLQSRNMLMMILVFGIIIYSFYVGQLLWGIIAAIMILLLTRQFLPKDDLMIPKMIVSNYREGVCFFHGCDRHSRRRTAW